MRRIIIPILFGLSLVTVGLAEDKQPPLQAREPTVVTVHGSAETVREGRSKQRSALGKAVYGAGRGARRAWNAIVDGIPSLFGGDDVVLSERERRAQENEKSR